MYGTVVAGGTESLQNMTDLSALIELVNDDFTCDKQVVVRLANLLPGVTDLDTLMSLFDLAPRSTKVEAAVESRMAQIIPEVLAVIQDPERLLDLVRHTSSGSACRSLIGKRMTDLLVAGLAEETDFPSLVRRHSYLTVGLGAKDSVQTRIEQVLAAISDFRQLLAFWSLCVSSPWLKKALTARLEAVVEAIKLSPTNRELPPWMLEFLASPPRVPASIKAVLLKKVQAFFDLLPVD